MLPYRYPFVIDVIVVTSTRSTLFLPSLLGPLIRGTGAGRAYPRALTRAHVHVRYINYNDFLPLMPERDLNYRYPPAWRARSGRERDSRLRGRGGEKERESERASEGAPAGPQS